MILSHPFEIRVELIDPETDTTITEGRPDYTLVERAIDVGTREGPFTAILEDGVWKLSHPSYPNAREVIIVIDLV